MDAAPLCGSPASLRHLRAPAEEGRVTQFTEWNPYVAVHLRNQVNTFSLAQCDVVNLLIDTLPFGAR
jgi:hypothetical protein